ncbi:coproporphyrinogen dehydrogenase HemZ [Peptoniphilus mikwangii]|uniref:coproporphyrinogen dehydrogenase HemZ n=1 Tax=Peptoniphilus mikwangii TaxID=1354300 RepID=UPI0004058C12|nr:coproporphyrinogen dehydrogenase HemZ [Peptoniphilus mikwangii]
MINVVCEILTVAHEAYEFLRLKFPSYEKEGNIFVNIDFDKNILEISCDFLKKKVFIAKCETLKDKKVLIKQILFENFENYFEVKNKWGILTGIRPTKLAFKLLEKNSRTEAENILKNTYLVSDESIKLIMNIVDLESKIIYPLNKNSYSIYVHIPFCPSKCSYCSFQTLKLNKDVIKKYVDKLICDLINESKYFKNPPRSIYIGGGTPTSIDIYYLESILKTILKYYGIADEFTVECGRPDTINFDVLDMLKYNKVNRISINPQSMREKTLDLIGRNHTISEIYNSYNLARKVGFNSINMDLIIGLPQEKYNDVEYSIDKILELNPENITVHTLAIKNGSEIYDKNIKLSSNIDSIIEMTKDKLKIKGYNPYYMYRQKRMLGNGENIGYSKNGFESIYNVLIMEEKHSIIGFGMSSSTKIYYPDENKLKTIMNFRNMKDYLSREDEIFTVKKKIYEKFDF